MSNVFDDVRAAVRQAEETQRAVDLQTDRMAKLIVGRLKRVDTDTLAELKRELRDYDIARRRWRKG